jgi:uncharacterized membrane protein
MANAAIIFGLLIGPYLVAYVFHLNVTMGGRLGIGVVFLFAAVGHFFKTESMLPMLPPFVPARRALIYLSGVVEVLFAVTFVTLPDPSFVGWSVIIYLIVIFPSNIYAAVRRIPFGGHSMGPLYLFVRFPLQMLLILWTYWFSVRTH